MVEVEILQLLVSPVHRYAGRPADGPAPAADDELVPRIAIRSGLGIVTDRYFGKPAHRDASVTLMSAQNLSVGGTDLPVDLRQTRRNVLMRGVEIDAYIGSVIALDSGEGPVVLAVNRAAPPCAWMDATIGPGAQRMLRGKGGVRCTPLSDGVLTLGPAAFTVT
jgi:MOSC domain-containing protein YiiM